MTCDSVGGDMTAAVTLLAGARGGPAIRQQLLYPITNAFDTEFHHQFAAGCSRRRDAMMWFWDQHTTDLEQRNKITASLVHAGGSAYREVGTMSESFVSRAFRGRRPPDEVTARLPPGQYFERGFPVLSAGPTPYTPLDRWDFAVLGSVGRPKRWTWDELRALPHESVTADIHCVTKWSKLDTHWEGVSVDTLLAGVESAAGYVVAFCDGGYSTNLPRHEVTEGKAWIVYAYEGAPIPPEHGGPARLLVPHLYFWKSAKWVRGLRLVDEDEPGFWETLGYHNLGDPWKEQRYAGD